MICKVCGVVAPVMKRCVRCKNVLYCSKSCQMDDWPVHKYNCLTTSHLPYSKNNNSDGLMMKTEESHKLKLIIKHNHRKQCILLQQPIHDASKILTLISEALCVPLDTLNLIAKGKVVTKENIIDILVNKKIKQFMAVGEALESEVGLHLEDIETIMQQLQVDRRKAVRGLKHCDGNLIDAMLYLGDLA